MYMMQIYRCPTYERCKLACLYIKWVQVMAVFYVYAYVGVIAFRNVKRNEYLNEHANFESFGKALLTLFRIATVDNWTGIMAQCSISAPQCEPELKNCGNKIFAYLYFMSFALLIGQIMLNLFATIVVEKFEEHEAHLKWDLRPAHLQV